MGKRFVAWLKKYFIPHEHNNYKPHILRVEATIFILVLVVLAEAAFLTQFFILSSGRGFLAQVLQNVLIEETNNNRLAEKFSSLNFNPILSAAAQAKAEDMAEKSYFSHVSPEGVSPWQWFENFGYQYEYAGENLAVNFYDSKDVVDAWMRSPSHRENILNSHFTEIGIGVANGIYQGREATFVVQFFGKPFVQAPAKNFPAVAVVGQQQTLQQPSSSVPENQPAAGVLPEVLSIGYTAGANSSEPEKESLLVQEVIASPRLRTQYIYFGLSAIICLALVLRIFIKVKIQHPKIILNGIVLIIVINTVLLINNYLFVAGGKVF